MFTERQSKILEILLNNVQGVTGAKLSEYLGVSSRTIRTEISEINRVWKDGDLVRASRRSGYSIDEQKLDAVRGCLMSGNTSQSENPFSRGASILGIVLETGESDIFTVGERLALSETAVYKEVVKLQRHLLADYQCELLHMGARQLRIDDPESKIRQTLFHIIRNEAQQGIHLYPSFLKAFLGQAFDPEEYEWMLGLVKEYFDSRHMPVADANLYMIVSAVYLTIVRDCQGHTAPPDPDADPAEPPAQEFFSYLEKGGIALGKGDWQILGSLIRGMKLIPNPAAENVVSEISALILSSFCEEVMVKYHFDLWQSQSFYDNLLIHIEYMIRRMDTGYEMTNPILEEIKNQYPYAYEISMLIVPIVYRYKNCFIRDGEVAYIAIFVEHFLENVNQKLKAVIISSVRFSVNNIVRNWMRMNFQNQIEILDMIPQHRLEQFLEEHPVDLIISTMDSVVHPVIATFKIDGIPNPYTLTAMNALIHKIRMNYRFREIIHEHFDPKAIRIYRDPASFEEVIRDLCLLLQRGDYIEDAEEFAKDVLEREVNYPTNIGDWMMIPHPLLTFAKKTVIGAALLKKPIHIQKKDVQLIFLLALDPKQNDKMGILFQFFKHMAQEKTSLAMLSPVENEEDFIDVLVQISNCTETS